MPPPLGRRLVARVHPGLRCRPPGRTRHDTPPSPAGYPRRPATLSPALWCHIVAQHGQNGRDDHHRNDRHRNDRRRAPQRRRPRLDRLDRHAGAGRDRGPAGAVPRGRAWRPAARTSRCSPRRPGRTACGGSPSRTRAAAAALRRELPGVEVLAGPDAATELTATTPADTVLNGITGSRGLGPTLAALATGATLALANKESLVAGGPLVTAAARPGQIVPVDSEHSALAQCLRGGRARRGRAAGAHRVRRPVPRAAARRAGRRHRRAGAGAPDLGHGAGRHDQLRDAGQQGPRGDRGAPAVRRALRPDRRRRAPAVGGALDGHVRRRLDDRAGQPARHAAADRAGAGLAGPGARGGRAPARGTPPRRGRSSRWTTTRSPACGSPARPGRRAAACPPCSTRRTRRPSPRSSPAGCASPSSPTSSRPPLAAADGWRADPATPADVAAAEEWARAHARERVTAAVR